MLPKEKESDNNCDTDLNEILLNIMPNIWSRQVYLKGFDCETITKTNL